MGMMVFACGCVVATSMFAPYEIMGVGACFEHSLDDRVHVALKELYDVAGETFPVNFQEPAVQEALVAVASLIREMAA